MHNLTQRGYFVLADISGYTSFIAQTELEHSQDILSDLLGTICDSLELLLTIHKLEGDAVFAYTPETRLASGETILELVENTYMAFRARRDAAYLHTTCTCNACRNIPNLDLHARLAELEAARRVFIAPENAHATRGYDYQAPIAVVWDWFQEPRLRDQWMAAEVLPVTRGRSGAGSRNHCVHGQNRVVVEDYLPHRAAFTNLAPLEAQDDRRIDPFC